MITQQSKLSAFNYVITSYIVIVMYKPYLLNIEARGGAVVEALRYKPEGRGFDSRFCHWNFSLT
jgi:hypothetical protein